MASEAWPGTLDEAEPPRWRAGAAASAAGDLPAPGSGSAGCRAALAALGGVAASRRDVAATRADSVTDQRSEIKEAVDRAYADFAGSRAARAYTSRHGVRGLSGA